MPRVHGMVYEPTTGEAKLLDVNIEEMLKDLGGIYDLFKSDSWKNEVLKYENYKIMEDSIMD